MRTIEQLQAEHEKQIAALKAEHAIAQKFTDAGLPVPEYIGGKLYGAITVTYRRLGALSKAVDLMASFPVLVPFAVLRDGHTSMFPESSLKGMKNGERYARDTGRHASDYAAKIRVTHIIESPAPTKVEIEFFTRIDGTLFAVSLEFGQGYIDSCPQLAPRYVVKRGWGNRIESAHFEVNPMLYGMADSVLNYGSGDIGPVKKSDDKRYLFVSDHGPEELPMTEGAAHCIDHLRNIASQIEKA
ncbi:hypothetical protein D3C87_687320 [compost metagenome]